MYRCGLFACEGCGQRSAVRGWEAVVRAHEHSTQGPPSCSIAHLIFFLLQESHGLIFLLCKTDWSIRSAQPSETVPGWGDSPEMGESRRSPWLE